MLFRSRAVTGESITKAKTDAQVRGASEPEDSLEAVLTPRTPLKEAGYNVVIYDAGQAPQTEGANRLVFGSLGGETTETLENVVLDMTDCDLTAGLSGFTIGVNTAYCFALPDGAKSFLECDGKCVGYYRELDDRKEIVVGFDIRESDFPLRAEFPVFLANAMIYLSDTSWLAANIYYAGEAPPEDLPPTSHFRYFLNLPKTPGPCQCLKYYNSFLFLRIFSLCWRLNPGPGLCKLM